MRNPFSPLPALFLAALPCMMAAAGIFFFLMSALSLLPFPPLWVELLSHFVFQYFWLSALFLAALLYLGKSERWRKGKTALLCLPLVLSLGFSGALVKKWLPLHLRQHEGVALKVLQANVYKPNHEFANFVNFVRAEDPDVVIAQEITGKWLAEIDALRETHPYVFTQPMESSHGNAIFSKYPIHDKELRFLTERPIPCLFFTIEPEGIPVRFAVIHPPPPVGKAARENRDKHLRALAQWARHHSGENLVLAGDLNCTMFSDCFRILTRNTFLKSARRGRGYNPSWPSWLPWPMRIPIDHILYAGKMGVNDFNIGQKIGSDHLPTMTTLILRK